MFYGMSVPVYKVNVVSTKTESQCQSIIASAQTRLSTVYDIFLPATAIIGYALGLRKLSAVSFSLIKWQQVCNHTNKSD